MEVAIAGAFDPSRYGGKLFTVTPQEFEFKLTVADQADGAHVAALKTIVDRNFKTQVEKFVADNTKKLIAAMKDVESRVLKSASKHKEADRKNWLTEEAKGATIMLGNAMKTMRSVLEASLKQIYDKAVEFIDSKYKTTLRNARIVAGLKITRDLSIAVAAAALGVVALAAGAAVSVVTGGAGLASYAVLGPIVLGSFSIAGKLILSSVKAISSNMSGHKKALAELQKSLGDLQTALQYENKKKDVVKLGPKERIKLMVANTKGKKQAVQKNIKLVEANQILLIKTNRELLAQVAQTDDAIKEVNRISGPTDVMGLIPGLEKDKAKLKDAISRTDAHIATISTTLSEVEKAVADANLIEPKALSGVMTKVQALMNNDTVQAVVDNAPAFIDTTKTIIKAVEKLKG